MMSRILRLSDGTRVRLIEAGAGAPVLLIHGVGMRAEAWGPQIDALSLDHRVIAVDMPPAPDPTTTTSKASSRSGRMVLSSSPDMPRIRPQAMAHRQWTGRGFYWTIR